MIPEEAIDAAKPATQATKEVMSSLFADHALADAWDEGRAAGFCDAYVDEEEEETNPYRSQA